LAGNHARVARGVTTLLEFLINSREKIVDSFRFST
jgi:hypothetical protein